MSYLGSTPTTQSFISGTDTFVVGATAQTVFTLSRSVTSVNDIDVSVGTNAEFPPSITYYSIANKTLTLVTAISNTSLYVRYRSTTTYQLVPGTGTVGIAQLSATGTPSSTTFLRGDNTWTSAMPGPGSIGIAQLSATGTPNSTTFLRGDNTWSTPVATSISNSGGWSVTPSGTKLYFNYNGTNVASLDSSGNLIALANVTAYGTP